MMDDAALWVSLPMPAVLLDDNDLITDLNPAAEGFLNISSRAVTGTPVWDKLAVDAPIEVNLRRAVQCSCCSSSRRSRRRCASWGV